MRVLLLLSLAGLALSLGCGTDSGTPSEATEGGGGAPLAPPYHASCTALCEKTRSLGCDDETCDDTCISAHETAGVCTDAITGFVACMAANLDTLPNCYDYPPECEDAFFTYASCSPGGENGCGPAKCDDPANDACNCFSICGGVNLRKQCTKVEDGFECTCFVEEEEMATCFEGNLACHVSSGCCAPFLP